MMDVSEAEISQELLTPVGKIRTKHKVVVERSAGNVIWTTIDRGMKKNEHKLQNFTILIQCKKNKQDGTLWLFLLRTINYFS